MTGDGAGEHTVKRQLHMVWSRERGGEALHPVIPAGYLLRHYREGDAEEFFRIMDSAGWPGWDNERLAPWRERLLPSGWFIVEQREPPLAVASAMALRDVGEFGVEGGELGWLACSSNHQGRGLGHVASAAVTRRFAEEGYRWIHLYTEDFRSAALRIYFSLGYIPLIEEPEMLPHWRAVCKTIGWPYNPADWSSRVEKI